jgi:hypothetical protein
LLVEPKARHQLEAPNERCGHEPPGTRRRFGGARDEHVSAGNGALLLVCRVSPVGPEPSYLGYSLGEELVVILWRDASTPMGVFKVAHHSQAPDLK